MSAAVCLAAGDIFVPVKIDENDLYAGVLKLLKSIRPHWTQENIKLKVCFRCLELIMF